MQEDDPNRSLASLVASCYRTAQGYGHNEKTTFQGRGRGYSSEFFGEGVLPVLQSLLLIPIFQPPL